MRHSCLVLAYWPLIRSLYSNSCDFQSSLSNAIGIYVDRLLLVKDLLPFAEQLDALPPGDISQLEPVVALRAQVGRGWRCTPGWQLCAVRRWRAYITC